MQTNKLHQLFLDSAGVSTDTRSISPNSIFFALKGANFNGNEFAATALEQGAAYAVIDEPQKENDPRFIQVSGVLQSLQQLASFHRSYLAIPIVGLTGSNGKTTTKELINAVLSTRFNTVATKGNLNNHIGVPLTLLSMTQETEIGIVEMGANHQKEIAFLADLAQPDIGYITNFGKAHLQGFGGVEGVIAGKSELYDHLKQNQKTILLNYDDPIQKKQADYENKFSFGQDPEANLQISYPPAQAYARIKAGTLEINSHLIGSYNARNMAAAYALGIYFKLSPQEIARAIESYVPNNNRSQILELGTKKIILDAYNANPTSMAAALENFENLPEINKIAILGDMFELGSLAAEEHQQLVSRLQESKITRIYLIGENFYRSHSGGNITKFRSFEEFREAFEPRQLDNALVLIKGSRGMALERALELL